MRVVFRVDSSFQIGSGHVMRCLTLADELSHQHNASIYFICREHPGHLSELIKQRGYVVSLLPVKEDIFQQKDGVLAHALWLGATQTTDAAETIQAIHNETVNWLIIDHYAIDFHWEKKLRSFVENIMVIDDLADRKHDCDILLDQTYGCETSRYLPLVPEDSKVRVGSKYALVRPEFIKARKQSIKRRKESFIDVKNILVFMGGSDHENLTGEVLNVLDEFSWSVKPDVSVVINSKSPHLASIKNQISQSKIKIVVHSDVNNMAQLMLMADISIGAAGSTSWERCALGLPSLITVSADNQKMNAAILAEANAIAIWSTTQELNEKLTKMVNSQTYRYDMHLAAQEICDGLGCSRISKELTGYAVN